MSDSVPTATTRLLWGHPGWQTPWEA